MQRPPFDPPPPPPPPPPPRQYLEPGSIFSPDTSWGSHLVPLMACVCATRGPVLEVGIGNWSTPVLHCYCNAGGRKLVSIDSEHGWVSRFANYQVANHEVRAVNYRRELPELAKQLWSVVFLDHSPGQIRADDALLFRDSAEFILCHDYSGEDVRKPFERMLQMWPHRAVAEFSPSTLILGKSKIPEFEKKSQ